MRRSAPHGLPFPYLLSAAVLPLLSFAVASAGCSSKSPSGASLTDGGNDGAVDGAGAEGGPADAGPGAGVLQHHGDGTRAGFYVDPAFTKSAVSGLEPMPGFSAGVKGSVFAQPLFLEGGVGGQDALFVVTEANNVYALNADTGASLWQVNLGTPEPSSALPQAFGQTCGTIAPLGITSTPILDPSSGTLYVTAMTMQASKPDYLVFALSIADGSTRWSVDLDATVQGFSSLPHMQRGALAIQNGTLYVPFGGQAGGCLPFNGWVIGVSLAAPHAATGWHTGSSGSGVWAPSGVATDSTSVYIATAAPDTPGLSPIWSQSNTEAILRLAPGPSFSGATADFFAPADWFDYGIGQSQLGAAGVVLFDLAGSTPSQLAFAIGKTDDAYLVDRTSLGGIGGQVAHLESAAANWVEGAMAAYSTSQATYVAMTAPGSFCPMDSDLATIKVVAGSPPTLEPGWCAVQGGAGSPIATASAASSGTAGASDVMVWGLGTSNQGKAGGGKLRAFDGDTGALLAEATTTMSDIEHWISPIVIKGRLYVAGDKHVYAYDLNGAKKTPAPPPDAGTDAGIPASCLIPVTPDQADPCAPFGLSCQGEVYGTCMAPGLGSPCLPSVGCTLGLSCVSVPGQMGTSCQQTCTTTSQCPSVFSACATVDGGAGVCQTALCGPSVDGGTGTYYGTCTVGGEPGTCLPNYRADGTVFGACGAAGPPDAGAEGGAPACSGSRGAGPLCPENTFCLTGTSTAACLPVCDYQRAAFGVDGGGPSCPSGTACILLGGNVGFGACAAPCQPTGPACPSGMSCLLWNPYSSPNEYACLPSQ